MDHFVQLYQADPAPLVEAVAGYIGDGLARGEAAIVIATPDHRIRIVEALGAGMRENQLTLLDAQETLARFMANGMPRWTSFHEVIGGLIAELRLEYPAVRAYGEMVDVLWQRGERAAAIRLEEYWNELGRLQTFSLFCAYRMDPLDLAACKPVCKVHTHLAPCHDVEGFERAVESAVRSTLDQALCEVVLSLEPSTRMPRAQAALFWLHQNMPRAAERVLSELRASASPAA